VLIDINSRDKDGAGYNDTSQIFFCWCVITGYELQISPDTDFLTAWYGLSEEFDIPLV